MTRGVAYDSSHAVEVGRRDDDNYYPVLRSAELRCARRRPVIFDHADDRTLHGDHQSSSAAMRSSTWSNSTCSGRVSHLRMRRRTSAPNACATIYRSSAIDCRSARMCGASCSSPPGYARAARPPERARGVTWGLRPGATAARRPGDRGGGGAAASTSPWLLAFCTMPRGLPAPALVDLGVVRARAACTGTRCSPRGCRASRSPSRARRRPCRTSRASPPRARQSSSFARYFASVASVRLPALAASNAAARPPPARATRGPRAACFTHIDSPLARRGGAYAARRRRRSRR